MIVGRPINWLNVGRKSGLVKIHLNQKSNLAAKINLTGRDLWIKKIIY